MQPIYVLRGSGMAAVRPWISILILLSLSGVVALSIIVSPWFLFLLFVPAGITVFQASKSIIKRRLLVEIYEDRLVVKRGKEEVFSSGFSNLYLVKRKQTFWGFFFNFGEILLFAPRKYFVSIHIRKFRAGVRFLQKNMLLLNHDEHITYTSF